MSDDRSQPRRRLLRVAGVGVVAGLAGCSGGGDGSGDATTTPGRAESGETTTDGGDAGDTPEGGVETDDAGGTETEGTPPDDGTGGSRTLGDVLSMPSSYVVDSVFEGPDGRTTRSTQYVDGTDSRIEFESSPVTVYRVDDTTYQVTSRGCRQLDGSGTSSTDPVYSDRGFDRPVTGRDTVDGQEVYVVETTVEDETESGTVTLEITNYVSVETGRMVRAEQEPVDEDGRSEFTYRYESFDPIELPAECR